VDGNRWLGLVLAAGLALQSISAYAEFPFAEPASQPTQVSSATPETKTLQGGVTSLKVASGRSQIVKFAQPIMRISITDPEKADVIPLSPDQIMINGKAPGVTSLIVWDENNQEGVFDLFVESDTSAVLKAIDAIAPNEKIEARITDKDMLILSGQVSNSVIVDEIRRTVSAFGYKDEKFVDVTEAPVPQVVLEVKIAEANRSVTRQIKTSFSLLNNGMSLTRLGSPFDSKVLSDTLGRTTPGITPASPIIGNNMGVNNVGGLTGTMFNGQSPFQVAWDLLETSGKITTLAEPSLVCTHGRTASFNAGGEFPYVKGIDTAGSPIIEFKEFGVKLNFTPWIAIRSGRIELQVSPEVSNIDSSACVATAGSQVCQLSKRTTNTTVELKDGESLMISGILTRDEQKTWAKIPFISNLPIIGELFKNSNINKAERELVVVVTPRIVKKGDYGKILGSSL